VRPPTMSAIACVFTTSLEVSESTVTVTPMPLSRASSATYFSIRSRAAA
jgi:hypothetical protein